MRKLILTALVCFMPCIFTCGVIAADNPPAVNPKHPRVTLPMPQQSQIMNLNLMDALVAIKANDLTGVFGFVPEPNAAPALADYLIRNQSALKRFVKKGEQDLKEAGVINEWDQQVFLYIITLNNAGLLGGKPIPDKWMSRITALSLSPGVSLEEMTQRKRSKL